LARERESDVFFIGTANDISKLPPEFTRAERLDAVFFLDLPGAAEKQLIWDMYRQQFGISKKAIQPDDSVGTTIALSSNFSSSLGTAEAPAPRRRLLNVISCRSFPPGAALRRG
jgi:SpoVK/Ycf46/Vps4 family AAA+-type ATPase